MSGMKVLAKETAVYGMSSIIGKFINWCLTPFWSFYITKQCMGEVNNLYAYNAILLVILTFGMETTFFRFANKEGETFHKVYSTALTFVALLSVLLIVGVGLNLQSLADLLFYSDHPLYIMLMVSIIGIEAFISIPFAYLRSLNKSFTFMSIKFFYVIVNVIFNLFFFIICPWLITTSGAFLIDWFYLPNNGVYYIIYANLFSTIFQAVMLLPYLHGFKFELDGGLFKRMFRYTLPLLVLGIAGIMNQTFDRIIMPFIIPDEEEAKSMLGVYGTTVKIAVVLTMFTQAFRFAYEPFVFGRSKGNSEEEKRKTYALAMKYFVIVSFLIFLGITFYLDIIKFIIEESFWEGLSIVPIVMFGDIFMGVFFNLSIWYKLTDNTQWGAYFSLLGFLFISGINILFIPTYGYHACAWAIFISYFVMMIVSYCIGQQKYPIKYPLKELFIYLCITLVLFFIGMNLPFESIAIRLLARTALLLVYLTYMVKKDMPLKEIPYINRLIK